MKWTPFRLTGESGRPLRGSLAAAYVAECIAAGGDRDFFGVVVEDAGDGRPADVCHTGNGPNSKRNAEDIAAAHNQADTLRDLLREAHEEIHGFRDARCESCDLESPAEPDEADTCDCGTPTCRQQQAKRLDLLARISEAIGGAK